MTPIRSRTLTMISSPPPGPGVPALPSDALAGTRAAAGWEFRFVAEGARAEEMVRLYHELGFEVVSDPVAEDEVGEAGPECDACRSIAAERFLAIYTRRRPLSASPGDEP